MFHKNRTWNVGRVENADELVTKLTEYSWTLCSGFYLQVGDTGDHGLAFVNDATSEDGAQEWLVLMASPNVDLYTEVGSVTVSWMTPEKFRSWLDGFIKDLDKVRRYGTFSGHLQWSGHGTCRHCA